MLIRHIAAVGGFLALTGATAFDLLVLGSSSTETAIAGGAGTDSRIIGAGGNFQGVYRILWAENSNVPCYFRVYSRHVNQGTTQTEDANLGGASCQETSTSQRSVGFNSPGLFVNGIAVCRRDQRVKAIRLLYADVGPRGTVTTVKRSDFNTQPNCSRDNAATGTLPYGDWGQERLCPAGTIASQIKVYFRPDNPPGLTTAIKQAATGISLICRPVEVKD